MPLLPSRLLALLVNLATATVFADVRLPALISDHMVLQARAPVPVWGWASPDEQVSVEIGKQKITTQAGANGAWRVELKPLKAGAHQVLTVRGANTLVVTDVLAGEVWLGSGQSNMGLQVKSANDFEAEKAAANWPEIRMFTVANNTSVTPLDDCRGKWEVCDAGAVGNFSAALYFFGRDLQQHLRVPLGLINSSWGGTPIQSWMPLEVLTNYAGYTAYLARMQSDLAAWPAREKKIQADLQAWEIADAAAKAAHQPEPQKPYNPGAPDSGRFMPGQIYNGMIHPLLPYRLRGAVWYQGENNAGGGEPGATDYTELQTRMIQSWRAAWALGGFPFYYVQLPNYNNNSWPWFREGQANVLKVPNTGMAVTIDIGEATNIHPKNKQEVGRRLALIALAKVYGEKGVFQGPQMARCKPSGAEIEIEFQHTDGGLVAHDGALRGFLVAGADKKWQPADARIAGERVIVNSPTVPQPEAVRYDWAGNPDGNLYNGAGLPAMPFRSDHWH